MKAILIILAIVLIVVIGVSQSPQVTVLHDGSDGRVESISMASLIGLGRAVNIMREAAQETANTVRMESPGGEFFLLSAYKYGAWNFAILSRSGRAVDVAKLAMAQCGNCFSFAAMTKIHARSGMEIYRRKSASGEHYQNAPEFIDRRYDCRFRQPDPYHDPGHSCYYESI